MLTFNTGSRVADKALRGLPAQSFLRRHQLTLMIISQLLDWRTRHYILLHSFALVVEQARKAINVLHCSLS